MYSAGVVLYECLTGVRPFNGSDEEVVRAVKAARGLDPRTKVPSLPANVAELVKKATAQDPRERFASARQLGAAIARSLLQIGASSKEREVTGALSWLLEREGGGTPGADVEAVPRAVDAASPADSDGVLAVSEKEMLEASGPIRRTDVPGYVPDADTERIGLPLPPEAFRPRPPVAAVPTPAPGNGGEPDGRRPYRRRPRPRPQSAGACRGAVRPRDRAARPAPVHRGAGRLAAGAGARPREPRLPGQRPATSAARRSANSRRRQNDAPMLM